MTVLTGFEDNSVALRINDTRNVRASDCTITPAGIPARAQRSIKLEIGATVANAQAGCGLLFQNATPFAQADRVAAYVCLYDGEVSFAFRVQDARGVLFETPYQTVKQHAQFVRVAAALSDRQLRPVDGGSASPTWPIEIEGFSVRTPTVGRQVVYIDDLEVEHQVSTVELVRGDFLFDQPTHLYEPGRTVGATLRLENRSRESALRLEVDLKLYDSREMVLGSERTTVNLPRSGIDYRSFQDVVLRQRLSEPGLYRIDASVRASGWPRPARFSSSIAALPSNRALPRGRETFYGIRTNALRESGDGQILELELANEIGAQLLAIDVAWADLEPVRGEYRFSETDLERVVRAAHERGIDICLVLHDEPGWLPVEAATRLERQGLLMEAASKYFGTRVSFFQACPGGSQQNPAETARQLQTYLRESGSRATVLAAPKPLGGADTPVADVAEVLEPAANGDWRKLLPARSSAENGRDRLLVRSAPLTDAGRLDDAVAVLETLLAAAEHGLGGVLWFDLRDDTADPRFTENMRGLVARDFSPKMPLVGYATAVGMLHGLRHVGPLPNAPAEFHSALFVGAERQVAILLPRPNTLLPGLLAPVTGTAGKLQPVDFERRQRDTLGGESTPQLVQTIERPMFLSFTAERALADPVLSLARQPWLQLPATVLLADKAAFTVRLEAPRALSRGRSRIQLVLPRSAPVDASLSSRRLSAQPGDVLEIPVELTRTGEQVWFEPLTATVRVTVEGERIDIPLHIQPVGAVGAEMAPLAEMPNPEDDSTCRLSAAWTGQSLQLEFRAPRRVLKGSVLQVLLVAEGERTGSPVSIPEPWTERKRGQEVKLPAGWNWTCSGEGEQATCRLTVTAEALGGGGLGGRLRLGVTLSEPSGLFAGRVWRLGTLSEPAWLTRVR